MNISILSVFPDLYESFLSTSLIGRAREAGVIACDVKAYASFIAPGVRIDAPTFGHGAGMLIKAEVVQAAVEAQEAHHGKAFKVFFSPHGKKLDQALLRSIAARLTSCNHLMLLPARYEGMDARVEAEYADEIISVGDFVLMGGDLPAMMFLEGLLRLVPGIVGRAESVEHDSFSKALVDHPEYAEPVVWKGREVPAVIRSGNHGAMQEWRTNEAVERTLAGHFDWLRSSSMSEDLKKRVKRKIPAHYAVLMHDQVVVGPECREGTTSITSIDIHDIARSTRSFGVEQFFLVSPLEDQQKIAQKLLDFWHGDVGIGYNPGRHDALKDVRIVESLDVVCEKIEVKTGKKPLLVVTSAREWPQKTISYYDQEVVWRSGRPVLFVFGTGRGLCDRLMEQADFVLLPIEGFADFNHLSVRSAVATILDRWMGINRKKRD